MLIMDTDHFSEPLRVSPLGLQLSRRLAVSPLDVAVSVITLEEQARGWLTRIKQSQSDQEMVRCYYRFQQLFTVAANWTLLEWNTEAQTAFGSLRTRHPRTGALWICELRA